MAMFCVLYFQRDAILDLHSKFALRPHHVDIQSTTAEIRQGKKKEDRRRNHRAKI